MKKKKGSLKTILIAVGVVLVVALIAVFVVNYAGKKNTSSNTRTGSETDENLMIPYGDDASDDYDFAGEYFDIGTHNGTLTIEKDGRAYNVEITYAENEEAISIWTMSASYDKARKALVYQDATRNDYEFDVVLTEEDEGQTVENKGGVTSQNKAYTDGSGYIYLADGKLYWIDEKDDMGAGLLFEQINANTTIENESEAAEDESEDAAE